MPLRLLVLMACLVHAQLAGATVVFFGDSLTAGYGLDESEAYPALIQTALVQTALVESGSTWRVVNAGVSGDTTTGGVRRINWVLKSKPAVVVVALGANDGLRGIPIAQIEENLQKIIAAIRAGGAQPVLAGMLVPPNYGEAYRTQFAAIWPKIATQTQTPLLPFLLAGVAADPNLNQSDRIHPNAAGQRIIAQQMLTFLAPLLPLPSVPAILTP